MIRSFRHRGLRLLFQQDDRRGVSAAHADKLARIPARLNRASEPNDMALPGFRLHPLKGDLVGFWAVSVPGNWRIIWRFEGSDVADVDLIDYHWKGRTMPMKNPPHPGLTVRHDCLEPLGLTVTAGAKVLGVSRKALSDLVNGQAGISPEMAIRLSKAFGGRPEVWAGIQLDYDMARALKNTSRIKVRRVYGAAA